MSQPDRSTDRAFIIQTDGNLVRLTLDLDSREAQQATLRWAVGGVVRAAKAEAGAAVWLDDDAESKALATNVVASWLTSGSVRGRAVITGWHGDSIRPLAHDTETLLLELSRRFLDDGH